MAEQSTRARWGMSAVPTGEERSTDGRRAQYRREKGAVPTGDERSADGEPTGEERSTDGGKQPPHRPAETGAPRVLLALDRLAQGKSGLSRRAEAAFDQRGGSIRPVERQRSTMGEAAFDHGGGCHGKSNRVGGRAGCCKLQAVGGPSQLMHAAHSQRGLAADPARLVHHPKLVVGPRREAVPAGAPRHRGDRLLMRVCQLRHFAPAVVPDLRRKPRRPRSGLGFRV